MIFLSAFILFYNCVFFAALGAWSLELGAWSLAPYYIINSGCTKSEALANDGGAQALQLVELQDPFNCIFV